MNQIFRLFQKEILLKIDGPTLMFFTNRSLSRLMTDDLAVKYSYSGQSRGDKKQHKTLSFKKLTICKYLIGKHTNIEMRVNSIF